MQAWKTRRAREANLCTTPKSTRLKLGRQRALRSRCLAGRCAEERLRSSRRPVVQGIARFLTKDAVQYRVDGGREVRGRRIASSFAPRGRISLEQLDRSGAPCALSAMEAQSVQEPLNEHGYLLFFGLFVAGWQADELFLFPGLSLARRHCQRLGIKGSNWIKRGYQKITNRWLG